MKGTWWVGATVGVLALLHFLLHLGLGLGNAAPDLLTISLLLVARKVGISKQSYYRWRKGVRV